MAITSAKQWKKGKAGQDLTVPSGQTCRARRVNLDVFLKMGRIPNSLRPLIDQAKGGKEFSDEEIIDDIWNGGDPDKFNDLIAMVDMICIDAVLEPKLHAIPKDEDGEPVPLEHPLRDEDTLYVDEVDLTDRMFIFNFAVGGLADLESFREAAEGNVEHVRALATDGSSSE